MTTLPVPMTPPESRACFDGMPIGKRHLLCTEVDLNWQLVRAWCVLPATHPAVQDPDPGGDE